MLKMPESVLEFLHSSAGQELVDLLTQYIEHERNTLVRLTETADFDIIRHQSGIVVGASRVRSLLSKPENIRDHTYQGFL